MAQVMNIPVVGANGQTTYYSGEETGLSTYQTSVGAAPAATVQTSAPAPAAPVTTSTAPAPAPAAAPAPAPAPAPAAAPAPAPTATPLSNPSIVDYLNSLGRPADYASRSTLAKSMGIQNYTGTAAQNTQMLNALRSTQSQTQTNSQTGATGGTTGGSATGTGTTDAGSQDSSSSGGTSAPDPYAGLDPIQRQVQETQDAAKALGLPTLQDQINTYQKQLDDLNNEQADKVLNVNSNPWLSEGIREKQITNIQHSYTARTDALTHLISLTSSLYTQGQAQVDKIVSGADADRAAIAKAAQDSLTAATALAKDNAVHSVGGRELLINNETGQVVADLGPTTVSGAKPTQAEQTQTTVDKVSSLFSPGMTIPGSGGIPFVDSSGNATPEGFKTAMQVSGLPRATFVKEFGYLTVSAGNTISPKFGLTPVEIKSILGTLP